MVTRIRIRDIEVQWLNARCLNVIAKYARQAYRVDATKINMSSDSCLIDVVNHASDTRDQVLLHTFNELKKELKILLAADHLQPKLDNLEKHKNEYNNKINDIMT